MKSARVASTKPGAMRPFVARGREVRESRPSPKAAPVLTVFVRDLEVSTVIGVYEHERGRALTLLMDLDIELAACQAGETDRLDDTIDYGAVVDSVRRELAGKRFFLLERLAEFVADLVLGEFGARKVRVKVAKRGILPGVRQVGVAIERKRARAAAKGLGR